MESGSSLLVTDISDPIANNGIWGTSALTIPLIGPDIGDFTAGIQFAWTESSNADMQSLYFEALDSFGDAVFVVGLMMP